MTAACRRATLLPMQISCLEAPSCSLARNIHARARAHTHTHTHTHMLTHTHTHAHTCSHLPRGGQLLSFAVKVMITINALVCPPRRGHVCVYVADSLSSHSLCVRAPHAHARDTHVTCLWRLSPQARSKR